MSKEIMDDYDAGYADGCKHTKETEAMECGKLIMIKEDLAYEKGFNKGWQKSEYANKWIKIEDEAPEQGRKLLYFFDCTGISLGEYYGIEPKYCPETGHVFGSQLGWLTGDVTHWMYAPDVPEGAYEEGWEWVEENSE